MADDQITNNLRTANGDLVPLSDLIARAIATLDSAKTSAQILDAENQAKFAYDAAKSAARIAKIKGARHDIITKCHRIMADALLIEGRAKTRLADEYDAAQAHGEVQKTGGDRTSSNIPDKNNAPTVKDIGLTSKQIHEARDVRDAEKEHPGIVKETVEAKLNAGEEPTRADVRRATARVKAKAHPEASTKPNGKAPSKPEAAVSSQPRAAEPQPTAPRDLKAMLHAASPAQLKTALASLTADELAAALPDGWGNVAELEAKIEQLIQENYDIKVGRNGSWKIPRADYLKLAKRLHPDQGGEQEAFIALEKMF
jgi:hypothetical protein